MSAHSSTVKHCVTGQQQGDTSPPRWAKSVPRPGNRDGVCGCRRKAASWTEDNYHASLLHRRSPRPPLLRGFPEVRGGFRGVADAVAEGGAECRQLLLGGPEPGKKTEPLSWELGEPETRELATSPFAFGLSACAHGSPGGRDSPPEAWPCERRAAWLQERPRLPCWLPPAVLRLLNLIMNGIKTTSKKRFVRR